MQFHHSSLNSHSFFRDEKRHSLLLIFALILPILGYLLGLLISGIAPNMRSFNQTSISLVPLFELNFQRLFLQSQTGAFDIALSKTSFFTIACILQFLILIYLGARRSIIRSLNAKMNIVDNRYANLKLSQLVLFGICFLFAANELFLSPSLPDATRLARAVSTSEFRFILHYCVFLTFSVGSMIFSLFICRYLLPKS